MKTSIETRDDLSFTQCDPEGRRINWPRNNPGVEADWQKGIGFFDVEVATLAAHDETEAFYAIQFALMGMGGRSTMLEIGFIDRVTKAAVIGLRALREGAEPFAPTDAD
ncbi:hypothetical protein AWM79_15710 [Pseudomonas agarici]|uniref:Uncharacterized protein n=1 Tax=Pseudomonas agarici TaxID=46677 RepID=A0A0X1T3Z2_PSEAA|nr:hypothetical protein [Pseudomonas agarici]AMB86672.1 hypothetical protein AWM79_15710 [Pseudomonas agarici]